MDTSLTAYKVLNLINTKTRRDCLDTMSTKEVGQEMGLTTKKAYEVLKSLSTQGLITHLDPVNGNNLDCADWVRNSD